MIRILRPGLFCMAASLCLAAAMAGAFAAGAPPLQAEALRGVAAFQVAAHDNRQVREGYLAVKELEENLAKRLKTAGIPVGREKPCIINASVNGGPAGDGRHVIYTFDITVQLRGVTLGHLEKAAHMGDKVTVLPNEHYLDLIDGAQWITVWRMSRLGMAEGSALQDALLADLGKMTEKLIADYRRVNGGD